MIDSKIHVYFMPGMAASPEIFEHISLPKSKYEIHYLTWEIPEENETIESYAKKMAKRVIHNNVVLIGVSFGGVLVQEMSVFLSLKKLIIISSIKSREEMPRRMRVASKLKLYKVVPYKIVQDVEWLSKYAFGEFAKNKIALYKRYLSVNDKRYLRWALEHMVDWKPKNNKGVKIIHIHGERDTVFPYKKIKQQVIPVKKGSHAMIVTSYKWLNENLPKIIEAD